ncbi:MAG: 2-deoxyribose-5-phosphate aldolase [Prochlorococcus sp.]|nr:2-deoxyribose-5-phosphate aldolase [Prochlorococcaceae cyanobacterium Fu_MAG_50]
MTGTSKLAERPDLAPLIHQAVLDPHLSELDLADACDAARHFGFGGICSHPNRLSLLRQRLGPPGTTALIAVIAFPFGAIPAELKRAEAEWAAAQGAEQLDVVADFAALADQRIESFAEELASICALGLPVRAVLDMNRLQEESLALAVDAAIDAGVCGLQSGNGFGAAVTSLKVQRLSRLARGRCAIKAAGGLDELNLALDVVEAGATQLGTSRGPALMQALRRGEM